MRASMSTTPSDNPPGQRIAINTAPNLRDLGGWPTRAGGMVRRGLIYRSAELADLSGDDLAAFGALGVRTVYDLRTGPERAAKPDQLPSSTRLKILDVLADETHAAPAQLAEALHNPATAANELGGGKARALFVGAYGDLVSLPSATTAYRRLFTELADSSNRPALFHCTTGKDRTGWAAAALLMLLGVSDDDVLQDYLLTNDELLPQLEPIFDRFEAAGGDRHLLLPVLGVDAAYLAAAVARMHSIHGTVERYFEDGLGLSDDTITQLRIALIARPGASA